MLVTATITLQWILILGSMISLTKQERIPVGCVPPAHSRNGGVSVTRDPSPQTETPLDRTHWTETPLDRNPHGQRPLWIETPLNRDHPCGQTDTCENITFAKLRLRAVIKLKQESIPEGCVPPASVATTRYQYRWRRGLSGYILKIK